MSNIKSKVKVYRVGLEQLRQFVQCLGVLNIWDLDIHNVVVGDYVVVQDYASFGRMCLTPAIISVWTSYENAITYASDHAEHEYRFALNGDIRVVADYEIWQVVDDDKLWGVWERRVRDAKDAMEALRQLRLAGELTDYHVYVDGDCVLDSELTIPTMLWHIEVIQRSVRLDKDMTVSYRRLDLWFDKRDAFVDRVKFLRWLGAYMHRPAYLDLRTEWLDSAVLDDSGCDVGASANVVDVTFMINVR